MHEINPSIFKVNDHELTIVSLNIWGGKLKQPLLDFFRRYSEAVDVFCLQEVFNGASDSQRPEYIKGFDLETFTHISECLPLHHGIFSNVQDGEEGDAMFVRSSIKIRDQGQHFVFRWFNALEDMGDTLGRALQYVQLDKGGNRWTVGHFHGLWVPAGKGDNPSRISQSEKVREKVDNLDGKKVICGDWNLNPDTQSLRILDQDMRNLVLESGITSTRTSFYDKLGKFADYMVVSKDVNVSDFKVLSDEVSDHSPLYLVCS